MKGDKTNLDYYKVQLQKHVMGPMKNVFGIFAAAHITHAYRHHLRRQGRINLLRRRRSIGGRIFLCPTNKMQFGPKTFQKVRNLCNPKYKFGKIPVFLQL